MSTSASISIKEANGRFKNIYVHADGYLKHTGKRLLENFNTPELAARLVALGNLSQVGSEIGVKHSFEDRTPETREMCHAYGRDRGERNQEAEVFLNEEEFWEEADFQGYNYIFIDGEWYYETRLRGNDVERQLKPLAYAKFD